MCTRRWHARCRSMPSEAASVASSTRTLVFSGVVVELSDDPLALLGIEAPVEHLDPPGHGGPPGAWGCEYFVQVVERGPVLREDDDSLVVPLAVRETGRLDPIHEPSRPGVRPAVAFVGQRAHLVEDRRSRISARCRRRASQPASLASESRHRLQGRRRPGPVPPAPARTPQRCRLPHLPGLLRPHAPIAP